MKLNTVDKLVAEVFVAGVIICVASLVTVISTVQFATNRFCEAVAPIPVLNWPLKGTAKFFARPFALVGAVLLGMGLSACYLVIRSIIKAPAILNEYINELKEERLTEKSFQKYKDFQNFKSGNAQELARLKTEAAVASAQNAFFKGEFDNLKTNAPKTERERIEAEGSTPTDAVTEGKIVTQTQAKEAIAMRVKNRGRSGTVSVARACLSVLWDQFTKGDITPSKEDIEQAQPLLVAELPEGEVDDALEEPRPSNDGPSNTFSIDGVVVDESHTEVITPVGSPLVDEARPPEIAKDVEEKVGAVADNGEEVKIGEENDNTPAPQ